MGFARTNTAVLSFCLLMTLTLCSHVQNQYCNSDFVLKLTIQRNESQTSNQSSNGFLIYSVNIKTQIKITSNFSKLPDQSLQSLWFLPNSELRGLQKSQKYIISGQILTISGSKRLVTKAGSDWIRPWNELSHVHKAYLQKQLFDVNCPCKISTVPTNSHTCKILPSDSQMYSSAINECYEQFAYCAVRAQTEGDLRCSWTKSRQFQACRAAKLKAARSRPKTAVRSRISGGNEVTVASNQRPKRGAIIEQSWQIKEKHLLTGIHARKRRITVVYSGNQSQHSNHRRGREKVT